MNNLEEGKNILYKYDVIHWFRDPQNKKTYTKMYVITDGGMHLEDVKDLHNLGWKSKVYPHCGGGWQHEWSYE